MTAPAGRPVPARKLQLHSLAGRLLRAVMARRGTALLGLDPDGRRDLALVRETRRLAPLLMQDLPAMQILAAVRSVRPLGGALAEAGVFMGGSARLICAAKGAAPLHLFDAFETLQGGGLGQAEQTVRDHFGQVYSTLDRVSELLAGYEGVQFHPGWFPASAAAVRDERFCFVHLDLDLAPGTRDALAFFHPRLLPGGILIGDDYNLAEVRGTFEAFFAGTGETLIRLPWNQVLVVRGS